MSPWMKRTLVTLSVGAVVGFILWILIGRGMIARRYSSIGGTFSCGADVRRGLDEFVAMQLYSALGGAVLALLVMLIARRWWSKRSRPAPPPTPAV